ncbi:serine hydrolase domain-containing protein [Clostridium cellulovorans]|uniref:Beta-lactamase n=2 Tax=Clostridium cellulovorans TaxID=1493 RepID=D9SSW0_CLOC7|nr:serine hydrolase [Clostridium cellulovorans]ADL52622.1 beta-lactamase [Clostridium cellulovorans 743B]BAV13190.1 beta-lactamase [Clostridium cellulovorans]
MNFHWEFSTPEQEGLDGEILNSVDHFLKKKRYRLVNSILIIKNEKLVFERYYNKFNEESKNNIKSIWKSILSVCIGICIDKGYIKSLDEPITNYLEEFNKNIHPYHKLITIRSLLTMTSGIYWNGGIHYHCPMLTQLFNSQNWLQHIADIAVTNVPSSKNQYKEWDVMLLSAIITKASSMSAYDFCNKYLYEPLNISSGVWSASSCGISYTIYGKEENSDLTARDLAKIGLLFLNKGKFNGRQILSEAYINEAITPSSSNRGYGLLWWIFDDYYGGRGFGGQELNVIPDKNMVTVIQATPTSQGKSYESIHQEIIFNA